MAHLNIAPGMLKTWDRKKTKDNRLKSVWDELSNRADGLPSIPNAKLNKVPKDVVHYVNAEGTKGAYETVRPMVEGLKKDGRGGLQVAEGSGETPSTLYAKVYWNVCRKVMNVNDKGVEMKSTEWLQIEKEGHSMHHDWHAENRDHRCQMALLEGGDRYITEDEYWAGSYTEMQAAPLKKSIHPNIAFPGLTSAITGRNAAYYHTDMDAIINALTPLTADNHKFNLAALDGAIDYAHRFVKPVNMQGGSQQISYVILVSPMQALQLARDQVWIDLMRTAEKRGPDNRALSGIIGMRKDALVIEDMRSPILNLESRAFEYVTPMEAATLDSFYGRGKLNRKVKGSGTMSGTMEIARILGSGAIGVPMVKDISFSLEERDHGFQKELCSSIECGYNRLDFKGKNEQGEDTLRNISSALYLTPNPGNNLLRRMQYVPNQC